VSEDRKIGRWEDGKMGRWEDGKMGRWEDGKKMRSYKELLQTIRNKINLIPR